MLPHRTRVARSLLLAVFALASPCLASAAPMDVQLGFSSLPSAQAGFTYAAVGAHTGVAEATIFSLGSGALTMDSIGQSNGIAGGSIFYNYLGSVTNTDTKEFRVTARCLAVETSTGAPAGQGGFTFGFTANNTNYGFAITPTKVCLLLSSGYFVFTTTFDNSTSFHEYLLQFSPPTTTRIFRDGTLIGTSSAGFPVAQTNRIWFGDGTGGANARGQIVALRFIQDVATGTEPGGWSRLRTLYR